MKRIKEIKIKNFKAFQEEQVFGIDGKNVLVYGNNGAGKSSLFWALYTILQSSTKTNPQIEKYFKEFDEGNTGTHQSLKNVFLPSAEESYIKITSIDSAAVETTYTISHETINTNLNADTAIQELNLASDFINYKLLHNFYRGSHKQEVNLWPVFERDIFSLLTDGTQNWLRDIIKAKTLNVPRTPSGNVVSRGPKNRFIAEIKALNQRIDALLQEIETNANVFIKEHFYKGIDIIKLKLTFAKKFNFDLIKKQIWEEGKTSFRHENLKIKLEVEIKEGEDWKKISRVQSFLNEAQLTRIAISIRIGALRSRVQGTKFKILVLDDMLISLDMSNRMDIVRIILNKENKESLRYFDSFQKIILTHDKAFFNLIRRNTDDEDWIYYKFMKDESKNEAPIIKIDPSELQKAQKELSQGEFETVGNRLRRVAEDLLVQFDDPEMKKLNNEFEALSKKLEKAMNKIISRNHQQFKQKFISDLKIEKLKKIKTNYAVDGTLSQEEKDKLSSITDRVYDFLIELNESNNRKEKLIENTKEILDRVMNPASHGGNNPLYRAELVQAIESIKELKNYLNE
jgi:recombinational DNA repair ATPase RecF